MQLAETHINEDTVVEIYRGRNTRTNMSKLNSSPQHDESNCASAVVDRAKYCIVGYCTNLGYIKLLSIKVVLFHTAVFKKTKLNEE